MNKIEFIHKADLISPNENIVKDSIFEYLWSDYKDYKNDIQEVFIYTYIEDFEEGDYITEGIHWANRLGYFIARNKVELEDVIPI